MRKANLLKGRNIMAAGILGILVVLGSNTTLAAAEKSAAQTAGGTAVDEAGAEEIALADANITADKAERLRTKAEREDGESVYEVSFTADGVEYEYLIKEADGSILEWEMDGKDVGDAVAEESLKTDSNDNSNSDSAAQDSKAEAIPSQSADTLIGLEHAKEIALADAGLDVSDISFSKIKFEKDNRAVVYEVEFYHGRQEFEYTIDAYTGEVRKMEWD